MRSVMYYIEKRGAYGHGVFGIYDDLDEAKNRAIFAASQDDDDYHDWEVKKFSNGDCFGSDSQNETVYSVTKNQTNASGKKTGDI